MKMFPLTLFAACGVALATTAAYAGDDESKQGSGQAELQMMDTDHDGSVSASEHAAGAKKMFEMMDKDGDGIVTADEMSAAHKDMPTAHGSQAQAAQSGNLPQADSSARTSDASGKPMKSAKSLDNASAAKIKEIDPHVDGTFTAAEHEAGAKKMFEKMDKDHDGKLSAAELQAGHDKMMRTAEDQ
jgi:Ca2+-binding EF-hand superfamily protein